MPAIRNLLRTRRFALPVIAIFALAIAASTAIFSVFNGLFLSPLPFLQADRLVDIAEDALRFDLRDLTISYSEFAAWRDGNGAFEQIAAFKPGDSANLTGFGDPVRVSCASVTANFAATLGVKPILGRDFLASEELQVAARPILLSFAFWERQFDGRADIVGKIISLDNLPFTVIGVLPKTAVFPGDTDVWQALGPYYVGDSVPIYRGVGRMKAGVTTTQAKADLLRIHKLLAPSTPRTRATEPVIMPLREHYLGNFRVVSEVLLGGVGFVLLIACVNAGGLMLGRGTARSRELAIREALGAGRNRLLRELLTESVLLAATGSGIGVALGWSILRISVATMPRVLPSWVHFPLDWRVACFSIAVTSGAALLSGFIPAWRHSRVDLRGFLADATPGASLSRGRKGAMRLLIVGEIALAFMLLAAGGLTLRAFHRVLTVNPGFNADGVLTFSLDPAFGWPPDTARLKRFYDELLPRLRSTPGVDAAGAGLATYENQLSRVARRWQIWVPGMEVDPNRPVAPAMLASVTPGYFRAMGIEFVEGRDFDDRDTQTSAIIDEAFARKAWPQEKRVLGKQVRTSNKIPWSTVIGVVGNVRQEALDQEPQPAIYVPAGEIGSRMNVIVRSKGDPGSLFGPVREIVRQLDPGSAVFDVLTLQQRVDRSLWARRTYTWLFAAFGAIALLLAAAGIYGIISYGVTQRTREIGIRIAVGAKPHEILGLVVREGMALVAIGIAVGTVGAALATRLLQSQLAGLSPRDAWSFSAAGFVLISAALAANLIPARRAASVDPIRALRVE
jgi:putative ABC transport system permease protein